MDALRLLPLSLLAVLAGCAPDACRLARLASLPLEVANNLPVVEVQINGRPARLVIDTGSDATILTRGAAARLGVQDSGKTQTLSGAGGQTTIAVGTIDTLALGPWQQTARPVLLTDQTAIPGDGIIGLDAMAAAELELDIPRRRATFYRARTCPAIAPAFQDPPAPVVALATQQRAGSGHLFVAVELEDQPLRGMLDTGASGTFISEQAAEDAGLTRRKLERLPQGRSITIDPAGAAYRRAQFRSYRVGGITIAEPRVTVADLPTIGADVLVGEDVLGTRRVWFSFLLGRVWMTVP